MIAALDILGQRFEAADIAVISLLVMLEGVLSVDNALVLGLLAKRLPRQEQSRALTYGLAGAFIFRFIAIATATYLLRWWFVKLLGGAYLVYIALKHLILEQKHDKPHADIGEAEIEHLEEHLPTPLPRSVRGSQAKFWPTVFVIEMTDIAFAVDSILAAIALVGSAPAGHAGLHPKLWVVLTGGFLGVVLMRVAAVLFIRLLERFPRLELSAYLLVLTIGLKLLVDWWFNKPPANLPPGAVYHGPFDFHSPSSPAFWVFWLLMVVCFAMGFLPARRKS